MFISILRVALFCLLSFFSLFSPHRVNERAASGARLQSQVNATAMLCNRSYKKWRRANRLVVCYSYFPVPGGWLDVVSVQLMISSISFVSGHP